MGIYEWISVEDRLPEKHTVALVWCNKYGEFPFVCLYDDNEWLECYLIKEDVKASDITHWKPIEPPAMVSSKMEHATEER